MPFLAIFPEKVVHYLAQGEWNFSVFPIFCMSNAQERPFWTTLAFEGYSSGLRYTSSARTKYVLGLRGYWIDISQIRFKYYPPLHHSHAKLAACMGTHFTALQCTLKNSTSFFCKTPHTASTAPYRTVCWALWFVKIGVAHALRSTALVPALDAFSLLEKKTVKA